MSTTVSYAPDPMGTFEVLPPGTGRRFGFTTGVYPDFPQTFPPVETPDTPPDFPVGVTAYWKMDEEMGDRVDAANGHSLSENGGTVPGILGKLNKAASFNGVAQTSLSSTDPDFLSGGQPITISAWIKLNSVAVAQGIVGQYVGGGAPSGYLLLFDGTFKFRQANGATAVTLTSAVLISAGTWYHVVAGFDGVNHFMVINAGTRATAVGVAAADASEENFTIGNDSDAQIVNGSIDEVGIWIGTALTDEQIAVLYNGGTPLTYL